MLSISKTKLLVAGTGLTSDDLALLEGVMDVVDQFKYLGSLVEAHGGAVGEINVKIVQAVRTLGSLCRSVFTTSDLTMETSIPIYVLGVLFIWC